MKWIEIVLLAVAACVLYGIVHDQITARICVEYFTIGHTSMFDSDAPTLLGFAFGVAATWWVGVLLGVPLATACRLGSWPKREPLSLLRPLAILMACSFALAVTGGLIGWLAAANGWVFLVGPFAERVPQDRHVPFLIDAFAHNASYLAGFVGGLIVITRVVLDRRRRHRAEASDK